MILRAALAACILALGLPGGGHAAVPTMPAPCFGAADSARLAFPVIVQAPPPQPGEAGYPFHPLSAAATMQIGTLNTMAPGIAGYAFHWANRATVPIAGNHGRVIERKLNLQPSSLGSRRQRSGFSSIARANACTMAQVFAMIGRDDAAGAEAQKAGIVLVRETALADDGVASPTDACVLPAGRLPASATGVVLDYEVADGRTSDGTRAFLLGYAAAVHAAGRRAILLTNPLNAPTQRYTAIDAANAGAIIAAFDQTTLMLWSRNSEHDLAASYHNQRAIAEATGPIDPARLIIDFELAGTTQADAVLVHDLIVRDGLGGLMLWRNRAVVGGDCASPVNRRIAAAALGTRSAGGA